ALETCRGLQMKDSEFIDLLNLYLDHEISAADAARLAAEVQSNVERRNIYRDYCRMQKACRLLTAEFQNELTADTNKKVVALKDQTSRPQRSGSLFGVGAFAAAAACLAVIFVSRSGDITTDSEYVATETSSAVAPAL